MNVDHRPTVLSLCSGIGGLDLGIAMALGGARTVCHVEIEAACCELLARRMEEGRLDEAPVWSDLRTFDGKPWRRKISILAAGYPCSPFSFAGRGLAEKDPRHLWPEVARIISEVQPRLVVLENVPAHIRRGLDRVLTDLDSLRFNAEWGVYSASQAGAPQKRKRIFIVAYPHGERPQGWHGPLSEGTNELPSWPLGPEDDWSYVPTEFRPAIVASIRNRVDGVSVRVDRLRALGNAVCPPQAKLALTDLLTRIERHHYGI
mgnify:CR=1 FL=1